MSASFADIESALITLERKQFDEICHSFRWTEELAPHLAGSVQSYVIDGLRTEARLPVICAVGVNYTQENKSASNADAGVAPLVPYAGQGITGVGRQTRCRAAVISVLNAYQRNRNAWVSRPPEDPRSPMGYYGSADALSKMPAQVQDGHFILIMTNVCPFITTKRWGKQRADVSRRLLQSGQRYSTLDRLYVTLGPSVDLWIGHSALGGTEWVWRAFASFIERNAIKEWLLTFNMSPQAHLWFERTYRAPKHRLFPWYGPAPSP
jgi:hypothetical protein